MFHLFLIGIILYAILFLLAKMNVYNGITRLFAVINSIVIVVCIIFILVKTGLIRMLATAVSFLLIRLSEWINTVI